MTFDWDKYRVLAEELRLREDEASQRSSISRLYYAIYWRARLHLENNEGFNLSRQGESHKQIWRGYQTKGRTHKGIGINGDRLHINRVKADYEADVERLNDLVNESFRIANIVQKYLDQVQQKL
jgi:uncharacterized protein (UPF0332 family)